VPTTVQAGYPDSDYNFWIGVFVPSATPQPIVQRLYDETPKALETAEVKGRLTNLGAEPMTMSGEQFQAFLDKEIELNAKLVKAANISAE
jgi:tripartite-type tricarboxylate transporter receptor subunit TctC